MNYSDFPLEKLAKEYVDFWQNHKTGFVFCDKAADILLKNSEKALEDSLKMPLTTTNRSN